ncbi:MAG: hypothetical protein IT372_42565 [Polyangiaceae bacterium]|nr:hypothetical protein [Polyangiaceae bacterium]
MSLQAAADGFMALFGATGPVARRAALLAAAVFLSHRPELPRVVFDLEEDEDG